MIESQAQQPVSVHDIRPRGFGDLPCLYCGESGCVSINLSEVTGAEAFACSQCEAEFSIFEAQAKLDAWGPVLAWVRLAPPLGG